MSSSNILYRRGTHNDCSADSPSSNRSGRLVNGFCQRRLRERPADFARIRAKSVSSTKQLNLHSTNRSGWTYQQEVQDNFTANASDHSPEVQNAMAAKLTSSSVSSSLQFSAAGGYSQICQRGEVPEQPLGKRGEEVVAQIPVTDAEFVSGEGMLSEERTSFVTLSSGAIKASRRWSCCLYPQVARVTGQILHADVLA